MKRAHLLSLLTLVAILILSFESQLASPASVQHSFHIDEYDLFYEILHPLHEEALHQSDFPQIRARANELVARGEAIIKVEVPEASGANRRSFVKSRNAFEKALRKFTVRAKTGSDLEVKKSFTAVCDSFEKLAELIPTVYPGGEPPILEIDCPSGSVRAGSEIILIANIVPLDQFVFTWTVTPAKIVQGAGTRTITIDTTGLSGQTVDVTVEGDDQDGHIVVARCHFQVAPN